MPDRFREPDRVCHACGLLGCRCAADELAEKVFALHKEFNEDRHKFPYVNIRQNDLEAYISWLEHRIIYSEVPEP